ncbi:immunoglobulin-like domain-containing protein [Enterococcus sp. 5H]|uniref:immunoglobulin-like domain-containing protein n=1 Tax=Enterococcus sp. 5H TaxID=1229490 RepID=UPI00230236F8|nr:immunoglobulin-like domain-containing protein [Enterococcus sp. 5H]MDA9470504.1 hypothetical protein [Enterococcus sp. 5H]
MHRYKNYFYYFKRRSCVININIRKLIHFTSIIFLLGGSLLSGIAPVFAEESVESSSDAAEEIIGLDDATLDSEEVAARMSLNRIRTLYFERNNPPTIYVGTCMYFKGETVRWRHIRNGRVINNGTVSLQRSPGLLDASGLARINFNRDYLFAAGDRVEVELVGKFGKSLDFRTLMINQNINASAPQLRGVQDVMIDQGTSFDPMDGVTAVGAGGSNITSQISVTGTVNTDIPGLYNLTYSVTDPVTRLTTSANRNVIVEPSMSR